MNDPRDFFRAYPPELKVSTERAEQRYHRDQKCFALEGTIAEDAGLSVAWFSLSDNIAVIEGTPSEQGADLDPKRLRPVFRLSANGPPLVPTGLVFVRFIEGVAAEDKREQLAAAGYSIASVPSYARHSAWVTASDGRLSTSLADIDRLEAIPDIVNVEPQLLGPRARRCSAARLGRSC